MFHRQHAVLALATLVLTGWLAATASAAELTGPSTPVAPSACAAPALQLVPPAMLKPAAAVEEPLALPLLLAVPPSPTAAHSCQFQCLPMGCETCWIDTSCVEHCCSCNDPRCAPPC